MESVYAEEVGQVSETNYLNMDEYSRATATEE